MVRAVIVRNVTSLRLGNWRPAGTAPPERNGATHRPPHRARRRRSRKGHIVSSFLETGLGRRQPYPFFRPGADVRAPVDSDPPLVLVSSPTASFGLPPSALALSH